MLHKYRSCRFNRTIPVAARSRDGQLAMGFSESRLEIWHRKEEKLSYGKEHMHRTGRHHCPAGEEQVGGKEYIVKELAVHMVGRLGIIISQRRFRKEQR